MPMMIPRAAIIAALLILPLVLVVLGFVYEAHLGIWMGGWFVLSLVYLAVPGFVSNVTGDKTND